MRTQFAECNERKLYVRISPSTNFAMYWIYILENRVDGTFYYGYTHNLERRLAEHDVPKKWKLVGCEGYASELDARERERKLKHYGQSRTHLKNRLKQSIALQN